jgi:HD-GYP domain-containing protein (c-di-GMP phosphodiesterase class II)
VPIVYHHHERWDGSGYPLGLKGESIPLGARIFAVVDAFDAMTFDRPYSKAITFEAARAEIRRCSGSHFDPTVVQSFLRVPEQLLEEIRRKSVAP